MLNYGEPQILELMKTPFLAGYTQYYSPLTIWEMQSWQPSM